MGGKKAKRRAPKPSLGKAFRAFPQVSDLPVLGLVTRRSRVQIPPPLPHNCRSEPLREGSFLCREGAAVGQGEHLLSRTDGGCLHLGSPNGRRIG